MQIVDGNKPNGQYFEYKVTLDLDSVVSMDTNNSPDISDENKMIIIKTEPEENDEVGINFEYNYTLHTLHSYTEPSTSCVDNQHDEGSFVNTQHVYTEHSSSEAGYEASAENSCDQVVAKAEQTAFENAYHCNTEPSTSLVGNDVGVEGLSDQIVVKTEESVMIDKDEKFKNKLKAIKMKVKLKQKKKAAAERPYKPHKCRMCNQRFQNTGNRKIHENKHQGIKPYCCSMCGKDFYDLGAYKKHLQSHTGEGAVKCHICSKTLACHSHMRVLVYNYHLKFSIIIFKT